MLAGIIQPPFPPLRQRNSEPILQKGHGQEFGMIRQQAS